MCNPARCLVRFATGGPKERSHGEARSEVMLANRNGYRQKASRSKMCLWRTSVVCVSGMFLWGVSLRRVSGMILWKELRHEFLERFSGVCHCFDGDEHFSRLCNTACPIACNSMCNPARCVVRFATGGPKSRSHGEARSAVRELDTECRHVRAEQLR